MDNNYYLTTLIYNKYLFKFKFFHLNKINNYFREKL